MYLYYFVIVLLVCKMDKMPAANPAIVFREEFDDWALLFDPDSGEAYGLNPTSVFIWKHLDGKHTLDDLLEELRDCCESVPESARADVSRFIGELEKHGFVGHEM